ncbi:MAG TPA: BON domain-containing protein [Paraburkholderia sp.]|jgi:hyperosmotically inducible protein|nr:BON domain-containing protein [Paraburkholderia sp.]
MKAIDGIKLACGALLVAASLGAYAQNDQSTAAPASPTTAASPTATAKQQSKAARAANRKLGRQVRAALVHAGNINVSNITVRARDGAVTLQGSVPDAAQIERATQAAQGVAGVTSVKNALSVRQMR